jgi:hypothetical protein
LLVALAAPAAAEGDRALSLGIGWATFSAPGKKVGSMTPPSLSPDFGGALTLAYEHSISTDFSLRGELSGGAFTGGAQKGESQTSFAGLAAVGAAFRFDVLKEVPYAFGEVGAVVSGGGPISRGGEFVLVLGGGLDVLMSRSRSIGGELRLASFGGDVTVLTLGVRGSIRWGYF